MDLEYILAKAKAAPLVHRHNAAKEALQHCLLAALARQGLLVDVSLIGGTALRLLHNLQRYSEDLDFICPSSTSVEQFENWTTVLGRAVRKIGLTPHLSSRGPTKVDALVQKRGFTIYLAATAPALAQIAREGLQISFEFDLDPPAHTERETRTLVVAGEQVTVPTLTLASLMAGKLHILLARRDREKGRDWYDYLWYGNRKITPNLAQLQSAIEQTSEGPPARFWMSYIRERTKKVDWPNVQHDISPFLENEDDAKSLNEVRIGNVTPYPDFQEIAAELKSLGPKHPLVSGSSPVLLDIEEAAGECVGGRATAASEGRVKCRHFERV